MIKEFELDKAFEMTEKQKDLLQADSDIKLYGGARGGGMTDELMKNEKENPKL